MTRETCCGSYPYYTCDGCPAAKAKEAERAADCAIGIVAATERRMVGKVPELAVPSELTPAQVLTGMASSMRMPPMPCSSCGYHRGAPERVEIGVRCGTCGRML